MRNGFILLLVFAVLVACSVIGLLVWHVVDGEQKSKMFLNSTLPALRASDVVVPSGRWGKDWSSRVKHEPHTHTILRHYVSQAADNGGGLVVDAGCHVGDSLVKMMQVAGEGITFLAVDPSESKLRFVRALLDANPDLVAKFHTTELVHAGLSDKVSTAREVRRRHPGAWKVSEVAHSKGTTLEEPLRLLPATDLIHGRKVALVHLDVEGYEYRALLGMRADLERDMPPVMVEVVHGTDRQKVQPFLESLGYEKVWAGEGNHFYLPRTTFHVVVVCTDNYKVGKYGVNMIKKYCERHGYSLTVTTEPIGDSLHVNFTKNAAAMEALSTTACDFVVTMDADMCILDMGMSLRRILPPIIHRANVMFAPADYFWSNFFRNSIINAGFVVWRTCPRAHNINATWLDLAKGECTAWARTHPRQQNVFEKCLNPLLAKDELVLIDHRLAGMLTSKVFCQSKQTQACWKKCGKPQSPYTLT
jgi:FkbM family methyltransferase